MIYSSVDVLNKLKKAPKTHKISNAHTSFYNIYFFNMLDGTIRFDKHSKAQQEFKMVSLGFMG